jgi:hypothetical protein
MIARAVASRPQMERTRVIAGSITGSPAAIVKYTNGYREILYPSGPNLATMWITTGNWTGPAAVYAP